MATRRATPSGPRLGGAEAAELRLTSLDCGLKLAPGALLRRTANAQKRKQNANTKAQKEHTKNNCCTNWFVSHARNSCLCRAVGPRPADGRGCWFRTVCFDAPPRGVVSLQPRFLRLGRLAERLGRDVRPEVRPLRALEPVLQRKTRQFSCCRCSCLLILQGN